MAQRVMVLTECDKHQQDKDESVDGAEWTVQWRAPGGRLTTRVVDLCPDCDPVLAAAVELLMAYGRTTNGSAPTRARRTAEPEPEPEPELVDGSLACPDCDYVAQPGGDGTRTARSRLSNHARKLHGKTIGELLGEPTPWVCPDCQSAFSTPQGLGVHRAKAH